MTQNIFQLATKKPIPVETWRYEGKDATSPNFYEWADQAVYFDSDGCLLVRTYGGNLRAKVGDWIIKGVNGEFYPIDAEVFQATYVFTQT